MRRTAVSSIPKASAAQRLLHSVEGAFGPARSLALVCHRAAFNNSATQTMQLHFPFASWPPRRTCAT